MEHSDLGGSFVRPQSAKEVEVELQRDDRGGGGVLLCIALKPRPVRPAPRQPESYQPAFLLLPPPLQPQIHAQAAE